MSSIPFTSLVPIFPTTTGVFPAPTSTDSPENTELPLAPGTREDCLYYLDGSEFQDASELEGMTWINQCQRAADIFSVPYADLGFWNADLANVTSPECAFDAGYRYCRQLIPTVNKAPELVPDYEYPIRVC